MGTWDVAADVDDAKVIKVGQLVARGEGGRAARTGRARKRDLKRVGRASGRETEQVCGWVGDKATGRSIDCAMERVGQEEEEEAEREPIDEDGAAGGDEYQRPGKKHNDGKRRATTHSLTHLEPAASPSLSCGQDAAAMCESKKKGSRARGLGQTTDPGLLSSAGCSLETRVN